MRQVITLRDDACIECGECMLACQERHGLSRIVLRGPRFGSTTFLDICQQCVRPECVRVCAPKSLAMVGGAVRFDMNTCTGCGLCAQACPYDVVDLVHPMALRGIPMTQCRGCGRWVQKDQDWCPWCSAQLPERVIPKVLVSKCDQCVGYADMACVRVCPTVALKVVDLDSPRTEAEQMMAAHVGYTEGPGVAARRSRRRTGEHQHLPGPALAADGGSPATPREWGAR